MDCLLCCQMCKQKISIHQILQVKIVENSHNLEIHSYSPLKVYTVIHDLMRQQKY